jgi:hypothetical protein
MQVRAGRIWFGNSHHSILSCEYGEAPNKWSKSRRIGRSRMTSIILRHVWSYGDSSRRRFQATYLFLLLQEASQPNRSGLYKIGDEGCNQLEKTSSS